MFRKTAQIQRVLNLEILTGALYATDLQPTEFFLIFTQPNATVALSKSKTDSWIGIDHRAGRTVGDSY